MAMKHRLGAEQIFEQTGVRPEYVPLASLYLEGIRYSPGARPEVLVHKCSHVGYPQLLLLLGYLAESAGGARFAFIDDVKKKLGKLVSFEQIAEYRAVVMVPHVPNTITFADLYAIGVPIFLPAEPEIYTWMWSHSDPYGGPGHPQLRSIMPASLRPSAPSWWLEEGGATPHPYSAFEHLHKRFEEKHWLDKAYWYQYSEYAMLPHTQRFHSIGELIYLVSALSEQGAMELSSRMNEVHVVRVQEVLRWTSCTVAHILSHR